MSSRLFRTGFLILSLVFVGAAAEEPMTIAGTGSSAPLMRLLFDEFRKHEPGASLNLISPPLGSGGSLKALAEGRIDLAVSGRPLKPEEKGRVGKAVEFAETAFVMATYEGQRKAGFSLDQLASAYAGKLTQWDNGKPIRLVLRASFESDTLLLRSMSPEMDQAVTLSTQRPGMVVGNDDLETLTLLSQTPGSLGPTTLGLLSTAGAKLSIVPIDGLTPSLATIANGSYPWRKSLIAVLPKTASPTAERFVAFLQGDRAKALLRRHEYFPVQR